MKLLSHYTEQQRKRYPEIINWENRIIIDKLSYSYRDTVYDKSTYPSNLHYHDYYELVIPEEGNIRYICEDRVYYPRHGDIILIPPHKFHMSAINCERTRYKRHVFYFYPFAFDSIGHSSLTSFLNEKTKAPLFSLHSSKSQIELHNQLQLLRCASDMPASPLNEALMLAHVIHIFYLLNKRKSQFETELVSLPEIVLMIQRYIDSNFSQISSVTDVAEHFFYSREYVSRSFAKYFNTTISNYITKRKVAKSQELILKGLPMIDISYQVGFGSVSTFIRSFKTVTGMTPTEYRSFQNK